MEKKHLYGSALLNQKIHQKVSFLTVNSVSADMKAPAGSCKEILPLPTQPGSLLTTQG